MRIRLLHQVANDPAGAVIEIDDRRALRLIQTGYAKEVAEPKKPKGKE
jgi:hypothetical protein